ncbi:5'-methylthioadenosine/adenosylhomocysteine nucleosidase [Paenibacillus validus]|uniref:adenosylhomocysteine nucleosidase n=1 Tax=Paenibacillus validus TaxID=44253 RepID=A0A7X2ZDV1_9BACL|nr:MULTISPECIES: 5'-methylthioadenosine/adenosylhomocysteine nucleosidase [Paenibacillus]MED4601841.1 5'-methylthioadenosine/adenosylhomocysteine nucleosidase [Paenibacillus validus]MED4606828.1 5'-methylthioadenosine/adenosylhomocysteine nucleosidase [Paenibacillus validus]MUG73110.1 5'-methylthioadenosine/adenosylhomocysteine nucleosidase [Paenibacillus validus]
MVYDKIGVIGAMKEEIDKFHEHLTETRETVKAGITFYEGRFHGQPVVLCKSGVGKVNAAVTTQLLIDTFGVQAVIFTGVAGAVDPSLNVGDIVVSSECLQHDMDVTALGFPRGTIPYEATSLFAADGSLRKLAAEVSRELFGERVLEGRVLSGDQFIASRETVAGLYGELQGACVEMEGAAVAQVCSMNGVPFVVIRSMSDKADGSAHVNFAEFTLMASDHSFQIVDGMLKRLQA